MLNFQVVGAQLSESFGRTRDLVADIQAELAGAPLQAMEAPIRRNELSFSVDLATVVTLASDKRLSSGTMTILPVDDMKYDNGIGAMILYQPDDLEPTYEVRVGVPSALFADLISAARAGRLPSNISVEERILLGDGKWDAKTTRHLDVWSIKMRIPIESKADHTALTHLKETVSLLNTRLGWLFVLVAILAAHSLWLWHPL